MRSAPVILLTGPKHSGKTSAGKALARLWEGAGGALSPDPETGGGAASPAAAAPGMGFPAAKTGRSPPWTVGTGAPAAVLFIDLDEMVEARTGKSPRLLYREGPELFRRAEAEALRNLLEAPSRGEDHRTGRITIAAAGGGLADNREALELVERTPSVLMVYIEVPVETAWERISAAMDRTGELPPFLNTENPRETHRRLHERRGKIYRELAAITVKAGNTPEETAAAILRRLGETPDREAGLPGGWPE